MGCCTAIVKYILYVFNLIFLICGILLIVLGSLMLSNMGDFSSFSDAYYSNAIPILIIVLGAIIFIVSFFGCCGTIKDNNCCTMTYAIFMLILFCLQLALTIWIFVKRNEFLNTMGRFVDEAWSNNDKANGYPMDVLQVAFKCCGKNLYSDYGSNAIPASCCGSLDRDSTCDASIYETKPGCKGEFVDFWSSNLDIISWAGVGVCIVELIAVFAACCVASSMRRSRGSNI